MHPVHHVGRYNPDTDSWSADVAPLSSPRSGACLVEMGGCLLVIGGHDGVAAIDTVERYCRLARLVSLRAAPINTPLRPRRYDPVTNTWSKQVPMLSRRTGAAAAVLDGHLYVMGGSDGDGALSSGEARWHHA